jgi:hypothetical protein
MRKLFKTKGGVLRQQNSQAISLRLIAIISIALIVGFSFAACDDGSTGGGGGGGGGASGGSGPPVITTTSLPGGTVGTPYNRDLTATGSTPITWSYTTDTLPSGLTLWARGALTGTPTTAGTYNFTVTATNALGSDKKTLPITIVSGGGTSNYSLDGVWENVSTAGGGRDDLGLRVRITGSTGVITQMPSKISPLWQSAIDKGFIKVGDTYWKNITKIEEKKWACHLLVIYAKDWPYDVATSIGWDDDCVLTMWEATDGLALSATSGPYGWRKR